MDTKRRQAAREPVDPELLREVRRIQVRTDRLVTDVVSGGYQSVFRGSGIEFDEVREWTAGDDFRSIDWNVTARAGRPFVKKYVEERELTLLFVLDRSRSMAFGSGRVEGTPKSLQRVAAEFCACLGLSAARNNDKVGLLGFSEDVELFVPARKGRAHLLRILRECIAGGDGERSALGAALSFAGRVQRKRAILFVISDFLCAWPARELRLLSRRHDLILVPCLDPRLLELPSAGLLRLRDLETGHERFVDTADPEVRRRFAELQSARVAELADEARKLGADMLPIRSDRSVASAVVAFFRRRELRGVGR